MPRILSRRAMLAVLVFFTLLGLSPLPFLTLMPKTEHSLLAVQEVRVGGFILTLLSVVLLCFLEFSVF